MKSVRLRHLLHERDDRGHQGEQVLSVYREHGVVPKNSRSDNFNKTPADTSNYKLVRTNDLVVNKMKAWQGSLAVSRHQGIVSGDYLVCEVNRAVDVGFLHHLLRSAPMIDEYRRRSTGIRPSQWRLYWEDLAQVEVLVPSLADQRAIADYLDTETARIDALITKKRRMSELLGERFQASVRSSLAEIDPVLPLKRRWAVIDCKHRTPNYVESGYPVVSPGDVTPGRLDLARAHRFVDDDDFVDLADRPRRPARGDIIYSRNASIGIAAYVDTDEPFCMGQDVCLITSKGQSQLYLHHVLNTVGLDQLDEQKIGSTFSRVNVAQILDLQIPTPPVEQQQAFADSFEAARDKYDRTTGKLSRQIDLLTEHRKALITAAVTGEIEVPGVAA